MTMLKWILKRFWFPILVFALGRLAGKYEWAAKTHKTLKTFKK
jgi:hypothetical protein